MITTEKCRVLRLYGDVMLKILSPSKACFRVGLAGMAIASIPQNHALLKPDNVSAIPDLDDLVQSLVRKGNAAFEEDRKRNG